MNQFKDLGIQTAIANFIGDKIKIERILNKEVTILDYKIEESKYKGKCLYMQLEVEGEKRVVFTGSSVLADTIQLVSKEDFPFTATILKTNDYYQFT